MDIVTDWERLLKIIPVSNTEASVLAAAFSFIVVLIIFGRQDNWKINGLAFLNNVIAPAFFCWIFISVLFFYLIKLHQYADPVLKADPRISELRETLQGLQEEVRLVYKRTEEIANEYKH